MERILKKILDAKWAWDLLQGPVYNRVVAPTAERITTGLIDVLPAPPDGGTVLDVGCGPGHAALVAAKKFPAATVIGVDYSELQVRAAQKNVTPHSPPNCEFRAGDAMALPFDDDSFDLVFSLASLKHWPDGTRGFREIGRVLKPGCRAYVAEADREYSRGAMRRFLDSYTYYWWVNKGVMEWTTREIVFGKSYSLSEARQMAEEAGFAGITGEKVPGWPFFLLELTSR